MSSKWQELAIAEANVQAVEKDIVLATIEAETGGRNVMGDGDRAYGYGQVWFKWHKYAFDYAAKRLNVTYPQVDGPDLKKFILSSDKFSMIVAVNVIKRMWLGQSKNWSKFTKTYVGPAIPDSDFKRRQKIWEKYNGADINSTVTTSYSTTYSNTTTPQQEIPQEIPTETFAVVPGSKKLNENLLYGRRYRILISDGESKAFEVSQLRCTFNIVRNVLLEPNYSEVTIYNLNAQTENAIIKEGMRIIVEAGYEGDQYGIIFDGDVLQPIREKESGVTYKLTINSIDGDKFMNFGLANFSILRGQSQRDVVENVVNKATIPSQLGSISSEIGEAKLTRGKVVFGMAKDILRQVAKTNAATCYVDGGKVNIIKPTDLPKGEVIDLSPTTGLIGTPTQTNYGAEIKCLINPSIKLNSLVHIDNSLIKARQTGLNEIQNPLDSDGLYRINQITYTGDTRGNDWYMTLDCITQTGKIPSMMIDPTKQNIY